MYNKIGQIDLETSATYSSPIKTNISFFNTDKGTAQLRFNITRNKYPLEVSSKNTNAFIVLYTSEDHYVVDDIEYIDPLNGIVAYTIPNDFLSKAGEVTGQLYINVLSTEDVITEVEFTFEIKDAIINRLPSIDKVKQIRTFAELREIAFNTIEEIKDKLSDGQKTVDEIKNVLNEGLFQINNASQQVTNDINSAKESANSEIETSKTNTISEINKIKDEAINRVNEFNSTDTTNWQKYNITNNDGTRKYVESLDLSTAPPGQYESTNTINGPLKEDGTPDTGYIESDISVSSGGRRLIVATRSSYNKTYIKTIHTDGVDNGFKEITNTNSRLWLGNLRATTPTTSILSLEPGFYECVIPSDYKIVDAPNIGTTTEYIAEIDVYKSFDGRKQIRLNHSYYNNEYVATVHTDGVFKGWKKVLSYPVETQPFYDTNWINWNLENGAIDRSLTVGDSLLYGNQYRVTKMFGITKGYIRFNLKNITSSTVVGHIPATMVPTERTGLLRTGLANYPVVYTIKTDGSIYLYINANDKASWGAEAYAIGEAEWIIDNEYFKESTSSYIEGESPEDLGIEDVDFDDSIYAEEDIEYDENLEFDAEEDVENDEFTDVDLADLVPDYGEILDESEEDVEEEE